VKRISVFLSQKQLGLLASEARRNGLKAAELIRRAIDQFFERNPTRRDKAGRKKRS